MEEIKIYTSHEHKNWLISIAIGKEYFEKFEKFVLPLVSKYSEKNNLGLACIIDDIDRCFQDEVRGKKKTWQKFLVPWYLKKINQYAENVCYFDSDILFNPYGKNIFNYHDSNYLSIVSQIKGLPFDDFLAKKIISFSRNKYYSDKYPLNSSIFMSTKEYYEYHGYKPYDDICCAGLYVANLNNHYDQLKSIFCKYTNSVDSITGGGDEPAFNYEVRTLCKTKNIPYEFQGLWNYEMAWRYRHLYKNKLEINQEVIDSICSCLMSMTALHFAGSWFESKLCYDKRILELMLSKDVEEYFEYQKSATFSEPKGRVIP